MNLTQLRKECKRWQKALGLQPWKITVKWSKPEDHPDAFGANDYDPNHMESEIKILHPRYLPEDRVNTLPLETLVHELLHLSLFPLEAAAGYASKEPDEHWELASEQFINKISSALLYNGPREQRNKPARDNCKGRGSDGNDQDPSGCP